MFKFAPAALLALALTGTAAAQPAACTDEASAQAYLDRFATDMTAAQEAGKLDAAAAHVTGSAAEVASLGEAFGGAVQSFGDATAALNERLQTIEAALEKSIARSDEQLAYYVAQAREVIELSMLSQKQIIGELQQLAGARDGAANA